MASTNPSKGVYVEHDLYGAPQKVVEGAPPERGYILIAPGTIATPDDNARVKAARDQIEGMTKQRAAAAQVEAAAEEKAVTEATAATSATTAVPTPVQAPSLRGRDTG